MSSDLALYEIRLGIFATPEAMQEVLTAARRTLADRYSSSTAERFDATTDAEPGAGDSDRMSVAELYSELPEQWSIEHPGDNPGTREVFELRSAILATEGTAGSAVTELTALLCPDPEHAGPCEIPWSSSTSAAQDTDSAHRDDLERRYSYLRESTGL